MTVPIPGAFGRFVFLHPRPDGLVLLGLTDEPYDGTSIPDEPQVTAQDEAFLLETVSRALARPLTSDDVVGRYAGLRPLLDAGDGSTADVSRRHAVLVDEDSGLVTVVGGKLTTYRRMAQDAVDVIAARPGVAAGPCVTTRTPLVGAPGTVAPVDLGDLEVPARFLRRFGAEAPRVAALAAGRPELLRPLSPESPVTGAEVLFAARSEGAVTLDDVLDRRTRAGLVPAWRETPRRPGRRPPARPLPHDRHPECCMTDVTTVTDSSVTPIGTTDAERDLTAPRMRFWGWGVDGHDGPLPAGAEALLEAELGPGAGERHASRTGGVGRRRTAPEPTRRRRPRGARRGGRRRARPGGRRHARAAQCRQELPGPRPRSRRASSRTRRTPSCIPPTTPRSPRSWRWPATIA